jgi:hypothetical protein
MIGLRGQRGNNTQRVPEKCTIARSRRRQEADFHQECACIRLLLRRRLRFFKRPVRSPFFSRAEQSVKPGVPRRCKVNERRCARDVGNRSKLRPTDQIGGSLDREDLSRRSAQGELKLAATRPDGTAQRGGAGCALRLGEHVHTVADQGLNDMGGLGARGEIEHIIPDIDVDEAGDRRQEVLWFANGNFKKVIHIENEWKRAGFGAKRLVMVQLVCACQDRVALSSLDLHLDRPSLRQDAPLRNCLR